MKSSEVYVLGACALFVALVAVRQLARAWHTKSSQRVAPILLLATAVMLMGAALEAGKWSARSSFPEMDTASVRTTFLDVATDGPQRKLVFHYRVQNSAQTDFVLDRMACAMVSFRFQPGIKYDPASTLLEKDNLAYSQYTGLTRLAGQGIELRPCPLILKPGASEDVTIAIPYAYPASFGNPDQANLRTYIHATMPNMNGFGAADSRGSRGILFPKGW